jgi:transposase
MVDVTVRISDPSSAQLDRKRDRLLEADVAKEFLQRVVERARAAGLTSDEYFSVDGMLLEAWASPKSFQPTEGKEEPAAG